MKTSVSRRRGSERATWYFVRLAFLAIPWASKDDENPKGTLFKHYHLIQAKDMRSAFNKARHILSISEHCEGDGVLQGERVIFKKIGILDLEPLYERLQSGVELFDESEVGTRYLEINREVITNQKSSRMIAQEKKNGKPALLDVCWGKGFDKD
jgi:hypothetical protein